MSYLQNLLNVYTGNIGGNNNNQNNTNTNFAGSNNNNLFNLLTQKISGTQGQQGLNQNQYQNQNQNQGQGQGQGQNPTSSLLNPSQMNTQNQLAYTAGRLGNMAIKAALL